MLAAAATVLLTVCATLLSAMPLLFAERAQRRWVRRLDASNCRRSRKPPLTAAATRRRQEELL
jgi:hypothetical protein